MSPRILKRDAASAIPAGHAPQSFQLDDIQQKTEAYLADVQVKARTILEEARKKVRQEAEVELQRLRQDAVKSGTTQAVEALKRERQSAIDAEVSSVRPLLESAAGELASLRSSWVAHWQDRLVDLAGAMAERIVRRELSQHPEISLAWIREALELASGCDEIVIAMHPQDCDRLGDDVRRIVADCGGAAETRIVGDPQVTPGGCRVRTRHGEIDQRLETQIRRLQEEVSEG